MLAALENGGPDLAIFTVYYALVERDRCLAEYSSLGPPLAARISANTSLGMTMTPSAIGNPSPA